MIENLKVIIANMRLQQEALRELRNQNTKAESIIQTEIDKIGGICFRLDAVKIMFVGKDGA